MKADTPAHTIPAGAECQGDELGRESAAAAPVTQGARDRRGRGRTRIGTVDMEVSAGLVGFVLFATMTAAVADKQCDVTVLYESHCPDSKNFIHRELVPMWHKLEQHCSLDLVPFGKARSTETGFSCQHGEKECKGNMIMSCALNRLPPGRKQLDFTSCFMADPDFGGQSCAQSSGLQWEDIENCMQSGEGTRLQKEAEVKSYSIRTSRFVPTIIVNKNYNQNDQNDAVRGDFGSLMCRYTKSPDVCS